MSGVLESEIPTNAARTSAGRRLPIFNHQFEMAFPVCAAAGPAIVSLRPAIFD
jgi:hypothetical protein